MHPRRGLGQVVGCGHHQILNSINLVGFGPVSKLAN